MHRPCLEPRCADPASYRGRCRDHSRQRERATHPNKQVYATVRWRRTRRRVLFDHPLCQHGGCMEIATDVDHIVPIENGGAVWDSANLRSLCHAHHSQITRAEQIGATR